MSDEQQRQALSAFSLLVDAANAQQQQQQQQQSAGTGGTTNHTGNSKKSAAAAAASEPSPASATAAEKAKGDAKKDASPGGVRQVAALQQAQNGGQQWDAMAIQEALQREMLQREVLLRRQQQEAALMKLAGATAITSPASGAAGGGAAAGYGIKGDTTTNSNNSSLAAAQQEAEYLQQLRLEALIQQRRQDTLAQLALAQELGISPVSMHTMMEAEQMRQAALMRQEALVAAATAGASGGAYGSGLAGATDVEGILAALGGGGGAGNEEAILQIIMQERERQRQLTALAQAQQVRAQAVGSTLAASQGHGMERADLIGSVFAKNGASSNVADDLEKRREQLIAPTVTQSNAQELVQNHVGNEAISGDSGTTILPCRARGMPMDHNVKVSKNCGLKAPFCSTKGILLFRALT